VRFIIISTAALLLLTPAAMASDAGSLATQAFAQDKPKDDAKAKKTAKKPAKPKEEKVQYLRAAVN
jgi:hypothetical protein